MNDDQQLFDALCDYMVYHLTDVLRKKNKTFKSSMRLLKKLGLIEAPDELSNEAYDRYEEMVIDYALEHFPDGYQQTWDYWGAKIISNKRHGTQSHEPFAGDGQSQIMLFDNYAALVEYTQDKLEEIEELEYDHH